MKRAMILVAVLCSVVLAADNAAATPQLSAGSMSAVVGGTEAITIPQMLSYQGKLTDTLGVPVPDGSYPMMFLLYTTPSGGSSFWSENQSVTTEDGLFSVLLGSVTPIGSIPDGGAVYLAMTVSGGPEMTPRVRVVSSAFAYLSGRAANADLLQSKDTAAFAPAGHNHDAAYVNEGQTDAVSGAMLVDGTVLTADVGDTAVTMAKIAQAGATTGQVVKWTGSAWAPGPDNTGGGSGVTNVYQDTGIVCVPNPITSSGNVKLDLSYGDGRYVNVSGDSVTGILRVQGDLRVYGKGRIGPGNSNAGSAAFAAGEANTASANYSSVSGGADNTASGVYSHVSGGGENRAAGDYSAVGGGVANYASGARSAVGGGSDNEAYGIYCATGGGLANTVGDAVADSCATVAGGCANLVTMPYAAVVGGQANQATGRYSAIIGGRQNAASADNAVIGGGSNNIVSGAGSGVFCGGSDSAIGVNCFIGGGTYNRAKISYSMVAGGFYNQAGNTASAVGGGQYNSAGGYGSTVAGGQANSGVGRNSAVLGGEDNQAGDAEGDTSAVVCGGSRNRATAMFSFVGGGKDDTASSTYATVGGGYMNRADGSASNVAGGYNNYAGGQYSSVAGGSSNEAANDHSSVAGGYSNHAIGVHSFAGGGGSNYAGDSLIDTSATVAGGDHNLAIAKFATVGGGRNDTASGTWATVGGGRSNTADSSCATVAGGRFNKASANYATVAGGQYNDATGENGIVAGGSTNEASGADAAVVGGYGNEATASYAFVGCGYMCGATATYTAVGGGRENAASGTGAAVAGGFRNQATGDYAIVPGGSSNLASGNRSLAAGHYAKARHGGCFVWSDSLEYGSDSLYSTAGNQWRVRARGGAWFYSNLAKTTGAYLAPGSNSWESACDSMTKEDFRAVDKRALLDRVAALRVRDYKMKDQNDGTRHIGPVAQDFHNAFGYGGTEIGINMADADGVALAAIQALYEDNKQLRQELEALKAELAQQKR